jgi:predicted aspartyl protease
MMAAIRPGARTLPDMGILKVFIRVEHPQHRGHLSDPVMCMVDTGSELTWLPRRLLEAQGFVPERRERFQTADGTILERDVCFAIVHCADTTAIDQIVFGEADDLQLLGGRTLEGLNRTIDLVNKRLVAAGPIVAAAAA